MDDSVDSGVDDSVDSGVDDSVDSGVDGSATRPAPQPARRRRLGDLLVAGGRLTRDQLDAALAAQRERPTARRPRLGQVVVEKGYLGERQVAEALAELLGLELVDIGERSLDPAVVRSLPRAVAERHRVVVLDRADHHLRLAAADPTDVVAFDDVRAYTGATSLSVVVATDSQIREQLVRAWSLAADAPDLTSIAATAPDGERPADDADQVLAAEQAPTVRLVDEIFRDAVRAGASDIHVEPQSDGARIRYRIDGLLRDVMIVPRAAAPAVISRIKIVSGLDIAERRLPQDGRARLDVDGTRIDSRISTLPAVHGEKVVIRLLAGADAVPALGQLGLDDQQLEALLASVVAARGLVLITGPTGSGKTNTLYSIVSRIATPDRNLVTLEDPVEIQLAGITQVQVNERTGLTFQRGLRAVLRQDPDVVLLGEVRDAETAEMALRAALTGHLVLTTLHTGDAVAALTRLVEMGIEPFLVASSLALVVAQRLVRRPCPGCAVPYSPGHRLLALLGLTPSDLDGATPRRGRGCADCGRTGYRGRTGVFEVLPVTAGLRAALLRASDNNAIAAAARSVGMTTLRAAAIAKARLGETTFEEVLRVTQVDAAGGRACPGCDRLVATDMVVCPWCETPLGRGNCDGCGRSLDPDWGICPWCRAPASAAESATGRRTATAPRKPAADPSILLVADDARCSAAVTSALDGVVTVDVTSADEAFAVAEEGCYSGVLVDDDLSDSAAVEVVRLLRAAPRTANLPVMLLRHAGGESGEAPACDAAADDILALPTDALTIEERVLHLIEDGARTREGLAAPA